MGNDTRGTPRLAIGIDVSDGQVHACMVDEAGNVIEESRIGATRAALERRFGTCERSRIALEAGTHSPWIARLLEGLGHEVVVANARKLRLIYENDSKSDRVDAQYLARLARVDPKLLAPIRPRSERSQVIRAELAARGALVQSRTKLVNMIRGQVKSLGGRLPKCSTASFVKKTAGDVPEALRPALEPLYETIDELTRRIHGAEERLAKIARDEVPQTALLQQVAGVGPLTSLAYVVTIEDPRRFKDGRTVGAYLGLRPRRDQSGDSDPQKRITKAGDGALRRLLVQSAHYILGPFGPDSDLRRWGMKLAARGGKAAKKRAVIAVARKLAALLRRLWLTGEVYDPLRNASPAENEPDRPVRATATFSLAHDEAATQNAAPESDGPQRAPAGKPGDPSANGSVAKGSSSKRNKTPSVARDDRSDRRRQLTSTRRGRPPSRP